MAHVDIPKGDLDGSADALSGPDYIVDVSSSISPTDIIYPCSKKQKRAEGQPLIYLICKMFTIGLFASPWDLTQAVDVYGSVGTTELFLIWLTVQGMFWTTPAITTWSALPRVCVTARPASANVSRATRGTHANEVQLSHPL